MLLLRRREVEQLQVVQSEEVGGNTPRAAEGLGRPSEEPVGVHAQAFPGVIRRPEEEEGVVGARVPGKGPEFLPFSEGVGGQEPLGGLDGRRI